RGVQPHPRRGEVPADRPGVRAVPTGGGPAAGTGGDRSDRAEGRAGESGGGGGGGGGWIHRPPARGGGGGGRRGEGWGPRRAGRTRRQVFTVGRGTAQHALVAGKTGSGKSTLLHALITNLAMIYGPDEAELYLIDFKKGVEFKDYAENQLPHARVVAIESER